jgi:hypothetical protein
VSGLADEIKRLDDKVDKMSDKVDKISNKLELVAVLEAQQKHDREAILSLVAETKELNKTFVALSLVLKENAGEKRGVAITMKAVWAVLGTSIIALIAFAAFSIISLKTDMAIIKNDKGIRDERTTN